MSDLWTAVCDRWGLPVRVVCDRFRLNELQDVIRGRCHVEPRVTQWSTSAEDIRALRRITRDGPLSIEPGSRQLIAVSLMGAQVQNDQAGNVRLVKKGHRTTRRGMMLRRRSRSRAAPSSGRVR